MELNLTLLSESDWTWDVWITLKDWNPKLKLGSWELWSDKWVNLLAREMSGLYTQEPSPGDWNSVRYLKLWDVSEKKPAFILHDAPAHSKEHNRQKEGIGAIFNPRNPVGQHYSLDWLHVWD